MPPCFLATRRLPEQSRRGPWRRVGSSPTLALVALTVVCGLTPGGYATVAARAQDTAAVRAFRLLDTRAFRGLPVDSAMARLARAGLRVTVVDSPTTRQRPGTVLSVSPGSTPGSVTVIQAGRPGASTATGRFDGLASSQRPRYVKLPRVVGLPYPSARAILADSGFRNISAQPLNSDQAPDVVIEQTPAGGAAVRADSVRLTRVVLAVSLGPAPVTVPSVVGQTLDAARRTLGRPGFRNTTVREVNAEQPPGVVIGQTPVGGTTVRRDLVQTTEVALVVSLGPVPPQRVRVPSVVGQADMNARAILGRFRNITVQRANAPQPEGVVFDQVPVAGTSVRIDSVPLTPITLFVSLGPAPRLPRTRVPGVVGQLVGDALATLARPRPRFMNVAVRRVASNRPRDVVIEQTPAGGTDVRVDSVPVIAVSLVVSLGPRPPSSTRRAIPGVVGQTLDGARAALAGARFTNLTVQQAHARQPPGVVIEQAPAGGTTVLLDSVAVMPITLVVSQGPPLVAVPALIGRTYAEAVDRLQAAGLHPGRVDTTRAGLSRGIVARQNPAPDSLVAAGSSVEMGLEPPGGFPVKWWALAGAAAAIAAAAAAYQRRRPRQSVKFPDVRADPVAPQLPGDLELVAAATLTGGPALQLVGDPNTASWQTEIISPGPLQEGGDHE